MSMKCAENIPQITADGSEIGASRGKGEELAHTRLIRRTPGAGSSPGKSQRSSSELTVGEVAGGTAICSGLTSIVYMKWFLTRIAEAAMERITRARWNRKASSCVRRHPLFNVFGTLWLVGANQDVAGPADVCGKCLNKKKVSLFPQNATCKTLLLQCDIAFPPHFCFCFCQ